MATKKRKDPASLRFDPADVTWGTSGHAAVKRRKPTRGSRALDERSLELTLTHTPTGISVAGTVPTSHYSRVQMKVEREKLHEILLAQLAASVARTLRLPRQ